MVKEGEFIDFAASKNVVSDIEKKETGYSTEFQVIIELSKKIKELELRIEELESRIK